MKAKRAFRAVIATALALILSFGAMTSAFAANIGDVIDWEYTEEYTGYDEYIYCGELETGENTIRENEYYNLCYTFEAESAGYYLFRCSYVMRVDLSEETVGGRPHDFANVLQAYSDSVNTVIAYLDEGNVFAGIGYYSESDEEILEIEYLGAELTDYEIDEAQLQEVIMEYDLSYGTGFGFDMKTDVKFIFDGSKEKTVDGVYVRYVADTENYEAVKGENTVTPKNLFGIEKQFTMTCCSISDYIEKVEISNLDKYLTIRDYYYPGDLICDVYGTPEDFDGIGGETVTVTLSDGTVITTEFVLYEPVIIELENGREVFFYYGDYEEDGKYYFVFYNGRNIFIKEELEVVQASDKENIIRLFERIEITLNCMANNLSYYMSVLTGEIDSYYTPAEAMFYFTQELFSRLGAVGGEIRDCCEHLIFS